MASKMVDYKDSPYESDEQCGVGDSSYLVDIFISLKEEIESCKVNNEKIMEAQEKQ